MYIIVKKEQLPSYDNKGQLSNCFSINKLVEQNTILKKRPETPTKCVFSAIVLNLKIDSFHY